MHVHLPCLLQHPIHGLVFAERIDDLVAKGTRHQVGRLCICKAVRVNDMHVCIEVKVGSRACTGQNRSKFIKRKDTCANHTCGTKRM